MSKCISDRILNYIESFLDKLENGYKINEYTVETTRRDDYHFDDIYTTTIYGYQKPNLKSNKKLLGEKEVFFPPIEGIEDFRTDIIDYYKENIRGELEFTNGKNPIMVAAAVIYHMIPALEYREIARIAGVSDTGIRLVAKRLEEKDIQKGLRKSFLQTLKEYLQKQIGDYIVDDVSEDNNVISFIFETRIRSYELFIIVDEVRSFYNNHGNSTRTKLDMEILPTTTTRDNKLMVNIWETKPPRPNRGFEI